MGLVDIVLLIILGGFVLYGAWVGLIQAFGAVVGVVFGAAVAGHYFERLAFWVNGKFAGDLNVEKIVVFIILFILVNRLVGLVFYIISKIFKFISVIPFLSSINRLAGAAFGLIEGAVVMGLSIYIAVRLPFGGWVFSELQASEVAKYLVKVGDFTAPFLPQAVQILQQIIPFK